MTTATPRLRMFAGPNGSGKSTLKDVLPSSLLGVYVNADDMEREVRATGRLNFSGLGVQPNLEELQDFIGVSTLLSKHNLTRAVLGHLDVREADVCIPPVVMNSYLASVLTDFVRHKLLAAGVSFTFETVMSSQDKVAFLCKAKQAGYRTYLYYIATEDPDINVSRVAHRVATGGHDVPRDKIVARYARSIALLREAIRCTDRTYIFDNSGDERVWVGEVTQGSTLEMKADQIPNWLSKALWDGMFKPS